MSTTVLELVTFVASQDFVENPDVFKSALTAYHAKTKPLNTYYGIQHEDKKTGYALFIWSSAPEATVRAEFDEASKSVRDVNHPPTKIQVQVKVDFIGSLGAPVTELAYFKLKNEESREGLVATIFGMKEALEAAGSSAGYGDIVEGTPDFFATVAWPSVEVHLASLEEMTKDGPLPTDAFADVDAVHVAFKAI